MSREEAEPCVWEVVLKELPFQTVIRLEEIIKLLVDAKRYRPNNVFAELDALIESTYEECTNLY